MTTPTTPPTMAELLQLVQYVNSPTPAATVPVVAADDDRGVTKLIVMGVVGMIAFIMLGLFGWVGTSVNGLNTTVTKMSANVDQLQKSIADLQQTQGTAAAQLSDVRATNAKQDAKQDAIDADINRIKERVRILEGQKPLPGYDGDR